MAIDDNTSYELTGRQVKDLANKVKAKADSASLASVATSGLYSDLTGAPTIPTVYNGRLTITQNGTTVGEFTANQSTDTTINLTDGGSTYTAGNGIDITNDEISVDTSVVATQTDLDNYVTLSTNQNITGEKTFKSVTNIQNGQGTGSLWVGGNVNASGATNNNRHLARIVAPSFANASLGATMLGFDTSGDTDMHVANKTYDALSFGGMKKITNATSPMAIGFCVADTRGATAAANKVYPLEMDASQARFNVQPNYNGVNLATVSDIPTVNDATLTIQQNGTNVGTFTANQSTNTTVSLTDTTYSAMTGATSGAAGTSGLVPAPAAGDNDNVLMGDGTWTALAQTVSNSNGSCIKFADGTMIATVKYTFTTEINGAWGSCFESPCLTPPNFAAKFYSVPVCTASLFDVGAQCYIGMGSGKNSVTGSYAPTVDRPQKFVLSRPSAEQSRSYTVCFTAIGRWKA